MIRCFKPLLLTTAFLLFAGGGTIAAQNNSFGIKDATYSYYRKCTNAINDSIVLPMLDTLFQMSVNDADDRMQVVSVSTRMDYYYFKKMKDSLLVNVERTKKFAREKNLSKYYYFAWTRLITYYINGKQLYMAILETEKMQEEALKENDGGIAVMQAYQMMGRIYHFWGDKAKGAYYFLKAAQTIEQNNLDKQYLPFLYSTIALEYSQLGKYQESLEVLSKAKKYSITQSDTSLFYHESFRTYISMKDRTNAKSYKDSLELYVTPSDKQSSSYKEVNMKYYMMIGDFAKAEQICDELMIVSTSLYEKFLYQKALCEKSRGDYVNALKHLKENYAIHDSLISENYSEIIAEKTAMFEINETVSKNQHLEIELKNSMLALAGAASLILVVISFVFIFQFYRIRRLNRRIEKSEKIKIAFLQNLSHEVRTPINSIMGFSGIIENTPDAEQKDLFYFSKIVSDNTRRLVKIFDDAIASADAQISTKVSRFSINECCNEICNKFKEISPYGITIMCMPCSGEAVENVCRESIEKIVYNLLLNAIKFSGKGVIILKTAYLSKNRFVITVIDSGPGIPPQLQERVFEPFYKVDNMSQGGGLGLPLSRMLAEKIGGTLKIDSKYTDGCKIIFTFPV